VAAGKEKGGNGACCDSRSSCEASAKSQYRLKQDDLGFLLLVQVDLLVPFSPDLGGSEHATGSTLVTECCLTCSVCPTTRYSRNTSDGSACGIYQKKFTALLQLSFVPVPHDSAEVCSPAFSLTAYGCLLFFAIPVWTVLVAR
jgi:hypothetical protein